MLNKSDNLENEIKATSIYHKFIYGIMIDPQEKIKDNLPDLEHYLLISFKKRKNKSKAFKIFSSVYSQN